MKAAAWIDRLKADQGWDSDYRAAKELGIGRATVSKYRSNPDSTMDDDTAVKVADALRLDPEIVVLDQMAERTRSEPARAALTGLLRRIGGGAKGPLDISSVTQCTADGYLRVPRSKGYASYPLPKPARLAPAVIFWLKSLTATPAPLARA